MADLDSLVQRCRQGDAAAFSELFDRYQARVFGLCLTVLRDEQWIKFLSAQPEAVYGAPARRSVAESPAFREQVGEERAAVLVASVSGDQRLQGILGLEAQSWLGYGAYVWLTRAYVDVVNGAATPEQALADAQAASDVYRACAIRSGFDALSDSDAILPCLLEADPSLAGDGLQ